MVGNVKGAEGILALTPVNGTRTLDVTIDGNRYRVVFAKARPVAVAVRHGDVCSKHVPHWHPVWKATSGRSPTERMRRVIAAALANGVAGAAGDRERAGA